MITTETIPPVQRDPRTGDEYRLERVFLIRIVYQGKSIAMCDTYEEAQEVIDWFKAGCPK